ncbi:hypothetical protein IT575_06410 [bacterium]|nr:hypothetical protein [bacterium]
MSGGILRLSMALLLAGVLALGRLPVPAGQARAEEAAAAPEFAYLVDLRLFKTGEFFLGGPLLIHPGQPWSSLGNFDRQITDGFFTMRYDLFAAMRVAGSGAEYPEWAGPADRTAIDSAQRFQLGELDIRVFAPAAERCRISAWRVALAGRSLEEIAALSSDPAIGEDGDGDGRPDGPGQYLGTLDWDISTPELGYIRDREVTAEELREMQFGVGQ